MLNIVNIKIEHQKNPLTVDTHFPLVSWQLSGAQTAYRIGVSSFENRGTDEFDVYDSGLVFDGETLGHRIDGRSFRSGKRYYVKLQVLSGKESAFSETYFQTALSTSDWKGHWFFMPAKKQGGSSLYRKNFTLTSKPVLATAYIAGIGYHELYINGKKAGDDYLSPSTSDYEKRVFYVVYDVTEALVQGENVIGIELAHGWYGAKKLLVQLNIATEDGREEEIYSTSLGYGWWVNNGAVVEDSIYDGEIYDARIEENYAPHWASARCRADIGSGFVMPIQAGGDFSLLEPDKIEPIKVCAVYPCKSLKKVPGGLLVDFDVNISGWINIRVRGSRGDKVIMRYGERLTERGELEQRNLRSALATDIYILRGDENEEFYHPRFTYHGFQYVKIETEGCVEVKEITASFVHTDTQRTGDFSCSDNELNYLHEIAVRTEQSNQHSILTDCPQRDERFGWLNDLGARLFQTVYNFDMSRFFPKFVADISDTQLSNGAIGDTAPYRVGARPADPVCVAYLLMPYYCYAIYGDDSVIKKEYGHLKRWVDFLYGKTENGIMTYSYYGDWVSPACFGEPSDKLFISTLSLYWQLVLFAKFASVTENEKDRKEYRRKADRVKNAIQKKYYDKNKKNFSKGLQTENAMALTLGVAPEEDRIFIAENIAEDVVEKGYHSTCGNVGYRHLFYVLGEYGYVDLALKILKNAEYPGWGYMVKNGSTSVWERWETEINNEMHSFNHPMFGSYDAFFYAFLGGIKVDFDAFGCDKVTIRPIVPSGIDFVHSSFVTPRGKIVSDWSRNGRTVCYHLEIPSGVTAKFVRDSDEKYLGAGVYDFSI